MPSVNALSRVYNISITYSQTNSAASVSLSIPNSEPTPSTCTCYFSTLIDTYTISMTYSITYEAYQGVVSGPKGTYLKKIGFNISGRQIQCQASIPLVTNAAYNLAGYQITS